MPTKWFVNKMLKAYNDCDTHAYDIVAMVPFCLLKFLLTKKLRTFLTTRVWTDEQARAAAVYQALMAQRRGRQDIIIWKLCHYMAFLKKTLFTKERML